MNSSSNFIEGLQDLLVQVPEFIQLLLVGGIAMVPFLEGELASTLGVWAGFAPVVAFAVAAAGNFLSVFAVVAFGSRAREAIIAGRERRRIAVAAGPAGPGTGLGPVDDRPGTSESGLEQRPEPKPESKGRQRFRRFLVRFGVPGASILGPLALPTQITSAMLVASGVSRRWVLLWQGVAIVIWTGLTTLIATGVLALVV